MFKNVLLSGLTWKMANDKHPLNSNNGDCYYNITEKCTYINDGNRWIKLMVAKSSNDYLMEIRKKKLEKICSRLEIK